MTTDELRERCRHYTDRHGLVCGLPVEMLIPILESLYREAIAAGLERAAVHFNQDAIRIVKMDRRPTKSFGSGVISGKSSGFSEAAAWCRQEAVRVKEGL